MQSQLSRRAVRASKFQDTLNILVIVNGISRKREKFFREIYPALKKEFKIEIAATEYSGHAEALAANAQGFDIILSAGGDGTMSQVVNGMLNSANSGKTLGLIPLGSGNDLARSLKVNLHDIPALLRKNQPRLFDVGEVTFSDTSKRFFINECSLGMGPQVVRRVEGSRILGASITYLKAIVTTFFTHKPERVHIKSPNLEWEGDVRVLAVANGKAFGHSIYIAPDAEMTDGKLNLFMCKGLPLVKFLLYLQAIKTPKKINDHKWIEYREIEEITIESQKAMAVEADGELIGYTPLTCRVVQKKIKLLA